MSKQRPGEKQSPVTRLVGRQNAPLGFLPSPAAVLLGAGEAGAVLLGAGEAGAVLLGAREAGVEGMPAGLTHSLPLL